MQIKFGLEYKKVPIIYFSSFNSVMIKNELSLGRNRNLAETDDFGRNGRNWSRNLRFGLQLLLGKFWRAYRVFIVPKCNYALSAFCDLDVFSRKLHIKGFINNSVIITWWKTNDPIFHDWNNLQETDTFYSSKIKELSKNTGFWRSAEMRRRCRSMKKIHICHS